MKSNHSLIALTLGISLIVGGCNQAPITVASPEAGTPWKPPTSGKPVADAAVTLVDPSAKMPTIQVVAQNYSYSSRQDPFRLYSSEVAYDQSQKVERILSEANGWSSMFTPTMDPESEPKMVQPRPVWRVSGIVVSENGIVALLDEGTKTEVIRPGQRLEGTPYVVASIDADGAWLRRTDGLEPKMVYIELTGPFTNFAAPSGSGGGPSGASNGNGNNGGSKSAMGE